MLYSPFFSTANISYNPRLLPVLFVLQNMYFACLVLYLHFLIANSCCECTVECLSCSSWSHIIEACNWLGFEPVTCQIG